MTDLQGKMKEQLEQFTRLQRETLESMQDKGATAVDYFEKVARFQLDVMGDVIDFTVEQAKVAANSENPSDYFNKQIDGAASLAKTVESRTNEYIELLSSAADTAKEGIREATEKATKAAS